MAELGRHPIHNKVWALAANYWLRLEQGTPNLLVNKAYSEAKRERHQWVQGIRYLLMRNGFGYAWETPSSINPKHFGRSFQQRLNDQTIQSWQSQSSSSPRFRIQNLLQENKYKCSAYLNTVENIESRNIITRLRLDMNKLNICQGRFNKVPAHERICPMCSQDIESVKHFLLNCSQYNRERQTFEQEMLMSDSRYSLYSDDRKIKILLNVQPMTQDNKKTTKAILEYITSIYKDRCKQA
jgi:uncharacterized protein YbaR (Trm112 family)